VRKHQLAAILSQREHPKTEEKSPPGRS